MNRKTTYKLTYGLFVLTAAADGHESGSIINTCGQVTTDPNRITIAVNNAGYTCSLVKKSGRFNVSVISEKAPFSLFQRFGFQSGRDNDKFAGYDALARSENGLYYVTEGTNGYFSATVESMTDLGTHTLFIARVDDMEVLSEDASASYAYYQSNIKPKPQKTEGVKGKVAWKCSICGYVYEGETLPEDYTCPLCGHPASDFEKIMIPEVQEKKYRCNVCGEVFTVKDGEEAVCPLCKAKGDALTVL